jgi:hypothetical protein
MKKHAFSRLLKHGPHQRIFRRGRVSAWLILAVPLFFVFSGCSTPLVVKSAVGPDPFRAAAPDPNGRLQVFTSTEEEETIGFSFPYKRRTAYTIYTEDGKPFKRVGNNAGHYDDTPRTVSLPPGTYSINAFMSEGLGQMTVVTVEIEAGRETEVHLDGQWPSPDYGNPKQMVRAPNGFLLGWLARRPSE